MKKSIGLVQIENKPIKIIKKIKIQIFIKTFKNNLKIMKKKNL